MSDDRLNRALEEIAIPESSGAEERGRRIVQAAYEDRRRAFDPYRHKSSTTPRRRTGQRHLPRFAFALGLATLLLALLLSPAGAAVRDWVGEAFTASTPKPETTLAEIPGGGHLLVQSATGPWVVRPDGSRRLLGDYEEATWSPRGLFVAAAEGRTLSAVEPDGTPRWSITAPARVADPRWSPAPGERIAYRSGRALHVIAGDGTGDRALAPRTAPIAPAWSPFGDSSLAYVSAAGALRIVDSENGERLAAAPGLPDVAEMEWGAGGSAVLEASPRALRLRQVRGGKLSPRPALETGRRLAVPRGADLVDAALAPQRQAVAAVLTRWRDAGTSSSVVVYGPAGGRQRLLTVPGSLGEVAWSPDGERLLVAWPYANQWLFLPVGKGQGRAVANVSNAFAPGGGAASFPRVEGWCCRR